MAGEVVAWNLTLYSVPPLLSALLAFVIVVEAWRNRETTRMGLRFGALMTILLGWSLAEGIGFGFESLSGQLFWTRVGSLFSAFVGTVWFFLTAEYSSGNEWLNREALVVLLLEPAAYIALVWTNGGHALVWEEVTLATVGTQPVLQTVTGPAYAVHLGWSYLLVIAGIGLLVGELFRSTEVYRKQTGFLIAGSVVPLLANVVANMGLSPVPGLPLTTTAFTLTGLCFGLALFWFDLLELTPVARASMIETMGDGLLVAGEDGTIREFNDTAERILRAELSVGESVTSVVPAEDLSAFDGTTVSATLDGTERYYDVNVAPIRDHTEDTVGRVVAMRDVTDRTAYEQRLEVTNRLLRHNLRNDMNVIIAYADYLRDEVDGERLSAVETIYERAAGVSRLSDKAGHIEETLDHYDSDFTPVEIGTLAKSVVTDYLERRDDVNIVLDAPAEARGMLADADLFKVALGNVIENAIEHNDSAEPLVTVDVEVTNETIEVAVGDNGPGIPESELEIIEKGKETSLEHGSGLGLWLVQWILTGTGGSVAFDENDPRGTVVTLSVPRSKSRARAETDELAATSR